MEILALLLLGLIAMLAIVPPIIRGKLEESPLATTQSFQRSMQEMANSIEARGGREATPYGAGHPGGRGERVRPRQSGQLRAVPSRPVRPARRSSAAARRGRVIIILTVFASIWGVATLISGKPWCLVTFAVAASLLVLYWALALLLPYFISQPRVERHPQEASRPLKRPAL